MQILASAKLNLCLDILKKDSNGYHQIQTVIHEEKSLHDVLEINEPKDKDNVSILNTPSFPQNVATTRNLAYQALQLLKDTYKIKKFADIQIQKNIPIASGLGGGSSNAAATLKGLNKLWKLDLSEKELLQLAAKLGCDVAFFIVGGTSLATNYGEIIKPLKPIQGIEFNITAISSANPEKTKSAYAAVDLAKCAKNLEKTTKLLAAIEACNNQEIIENLHNDFETVFPVATGRHLCGSGPSAFTAVPVRAKN